MTGICFASNERRHWLQVYVHLVASRAWAMTATVYKNHMKITITISIEWMKEAEIMEWWTIERRDADNTSDKITWTFPCQFKCWFCYSYACSLVRADVCAGVRAITFNYCQLYSVHCELCELVTLFICLIIFRFEWIDGVSEGKCPIWCNATRTLYS